MATEEIPVGEAGESVATTKTYSPTPYQDVSWPIVGEFLNQCYFEQQQFEVLTQDGFQTDPMFDDYTPDGEKGGSSGRQGAFSPGVTADADESDVEEYKAEIARLRVELESSVEEARRVGYEEGEAHGAEAVRSEFGEMQKRYAAIIEDIGQQLNENIVEAERKAATLAVGIARKLLAAFTETHRDYIFPLVREALSLGGGAKVQSVRVGEQDFAFLKLQDLSQHFSDPARAWSFEADPTIKVGCVVSTSAGEVDLRLDKAWERIRERTYQSLGLNPDDERETPPSSGMAARGEPADELPEDTSADEPES